jgi:hypothetical protein
VARSRHNNAVELDRGSSPYGILRQPAPLGKNICEMVGGVPVIDRGGNRREDLEAGEEAGAAARGRRAPPATVSGRRAHGWQGATVLGSRSCDDVGREGPQGRAVAHGGSLQ